MRETGYSTHLRNSMFKFELINDKKILCSDLLPKSKAIHLFTTRQSVVTSKDLPELKELCTDNITKLSKYLSIKPEDIIIPTQTHSDNIAIAKQNTIFPETDALIVDNSNIAILLNFADCTPVILYDEINNIGAIAHAGWRGTAASISQKVILRMQKEYGTNPSDITAIIGPAISMKNYGVGYDVFEKLKNTLKNEYNDYFFCDNDSQKYNVDLKTINQHQLEELGVKRIDKCGYCTYDSVDIFFSYRKENGKTARHSALFKLINQ